MDAVNSSHRIFHNSASESVITFGKKTYRRVSINEETTTQERKAQNLSTLSGVDPVRLVNPIGSGPVRSGPVLVLPTASILSKSRYNVDLIFSGVLYFGWPTQPSTGAMRVYNGLLLCTYI